MSFKDLKAISDLLNNKDYLLGKSPTTVDCVLFGHLAQFLYIPIRFPQVSFLNAGIRSSELLPYITDQNRP